MNVFKSSVFMLLFTILFTGCGNGPSQEEIEATFPMSLNVQSLEAINQDEETITTDELDGDIWLASFIFTNCDTVCSPMTATMSKLQQKLKDAGVEATLVSFSIDPENDTPEVLQDFGEKMDADFSNWHFLTGYSQETIESFANTSFLTPAAKIDGSNQFIHSTSIYLISQTGTVLQQYEGVAQTPFDQIISDVKKLLEN